MPRPPLSLMLVLGLLAPGTALAVDPHLDPSEVPGSCASCHLGHGVSRSPMLPGPQAAICLGCHENQTAADRMVAKGTLAPGARPPALGTVLTKPFVHPVDETAFSRHQPDVVTCTSCHSPHRGARRLGLTTHVTGNRKASTLDPTLTEFELCDGCHGRGGVRAEDPRDVGGLLEPGNRSFHPVKAPSGERSPSLLPELAGREINCTDCHGNNDPAGTPGVHGSGVQFLLRDEYTTLDGGAESSTAYALCYRCHDREAVLGSTFFPEHYRHVVEERVACSTCHNPHGAVDNRALVRFSEQPGVPVVSPSLAASRLAFVSSGPGGGTCYLTCHGHDHDPAAYGTAALPRGPREFPELDAKLSPEGGKPKKPVRRRRD